MSWASLTAELRWIGGEMDPSLSDEVHNITVDAKQYMYEIAAKYTHRMANGFDFNLDYMKGHIYSHNTWYALINDGAIPVSFFYRTTPFIHPTLDYIRQRLEDPLMTVISQKRGV